MGAAVAGALFGPVVGAAPRSGPRDRLLALAGLSVVLAVLTLRLRRRPAREPRPRCCDRAFSATAVFVRGLALMSIASVLEGNLYVLAPLHLAAAGWGAAAIGAVWLLSAGVEAGAAPLIGRLSDRRGALLPVRVALTVAARSSRLRSRSRVGRSSTRRS